MSDHIDALTRDEMREFVKKYLGIDDSDTIRVSDVYQLILDKERIEYLYSKATRDHYDATQRLKIIDEIVSG